MRTYPLRGLYEVTFEYGTEGLVSFTPQMLRHSDRHDSYVSPVEAAIRYIAVANGRAQRDTQDVLPNMQQLHQPRFSCRGRIASRK